MSMFDNNVTPPILTRHNLTEWKRNVMDTSSVKRIGRIGLICLGSITKRTKGFTFGIHSENVPAPFNLRPT